MAKPLHLIKQQTIISLLIFFMNPNSVCSCMYDVQEENYADRFKNITTVYEPVCCSVGISGNVSVCSSVSPPQQVRVCKGADRLGWKLIRTQPNICPAMWLLIHLFLIPLFSFFPFSFPMHLLVSYAASLHFTALIPHFPSPFPLFSFTKLMFARTRGYISLVQ